MTSDQLTQQRSEPRSRPRSPWRGLYRSTFVHLLIAVALGVVVGHFFPQTSDALKYLGDGFIRLIKMIIAPLVFMVVVTGIAKIGDMRTVGRIGLKTLGYFVVASTAAVAFGMLVGNLVRPGHGLSIDPSTLDTSGLDAATAEGPQGAGEFLLSVIPTSIFDAFATNSMLQILFFSVFFGLAMVAVGPKRAEPVIRLIDDVLEIIFKIMGWIMRIAPLGAFGAMAYIIGQYGLSTLGTYALLILACYAAALGFIVVLLVVARVGAGVPLGKFISYAREEFLLALGTASTEAVLPRIMNKLSDAGASRATTGLVVPTGYSFNMDGAAIYLAISLVFLTQAFGVEMDLGQQLAALGILLLTSKGVAGVPGSSFLALSATATAMGLFPVAGVALLLGADRIMDSMRVVVNLLGNCVATFVVARWEGQLDHEKMRRTLGAR
ncbi:cation:dicarboxylase symporter family transporter [Rothia sp. AR01]|uniref:Cation:dicarboxylase symporter family transporter n=1 Tax=Rothia santali TaxID=2949643 RepID=A0A9X2HGU5_9MICC|nr:cation:dicarboxylase symporter family transporter [Rothia santali]MCP3427069.1 cation:dicarboxylase symporter family transporter [Rothia santali]